MYTQIVNILPRLPEVGKIKIGKKGDMRKSKEGKDFQLPQKSDHFTITTLDKGPDNNFIRDNKLHEIVGPSPTVLDVQLLYDDPVLNFQTRYVCYIGVKIWCSGNGQEAERFDSTFKNRQMAQCPCERVDPEYEGKEKCKPSGVLSVVLAQSQIVGGVWKLRTTSYNSVVNILSSMAMIYRITGGVLSGIPLQLTLSKKSSVIPKTGMPTAFYIVGLVYQGSIKQLAEQGVKYALEMATYREQVRQIEHIAKAELQKSGGLTQNETDEDIVEEFYPEQIDDESNIDNVTAFNKLAEGLTGIESFIGSIAKRQGITADELKAKVIAENDFENLKAHYLKWAKKDSKPAEPVKVPDEIIPGPNVPEEAKQPDQEPEQPQQEADPLAGLMVKIDEALKAKKVTAAGMPKFKKWYLEQCLVKDWNVRIAQYLIDHIDEQVQSYVIFIGPKK